MLGGATQHPPQAKLGAERDSLPRSGGGVWGARHSAPQDESTTQNRTCSPTVKLAPLRSIVLTRPDSFGGKSSPMSFFAHW